VDLLIGTRNQAKFERYKTVLSQFPHLNVLAPADIRMELSVVEDGESAAANARKKAQAYASASGLPTLGIDEALNIPGLPPAEQPGTAVRRYLGHAATDEALLEIFLSKIKRLVPHAREAIWLYAICLALPGGRTFFDEVEVPVAFTDRPHLPIVPGYPLRSLLVDPCSGKPLRDLTPEEERDRLQSLYRKVAGVVRAAGLELG
jgi:inosine/xanthosine triphosphate pyrophosphatase family protein